MTEKTKYKCYIIKVHTGSKLWNYGRRNASPVLLKSGKKQYENDYDTLFRLTDKRTSTITLKYEEYQVKTLCNTTKFSVCDMQQKFHISHPVADIYNLVFRFKASLCNLLARDLH